MILQSRFYKTKKLLLVEDCEPVRASVKGMLQQIGFEQITAVADASAGLLQAQKQQFDFILADFQLGDGKDGSQFFTELKLQGWLKPGACYAIMSAEPVRQPVHGVLAGQPDCYLLKPFSYVELEKKLAKAFQTSVALRKIYQAAAASDYEAALAHADEVVKQYPALTLQTLRLKAEVMLAAGDSPAALTLYQYVCQQRDFSWARLGQAIALLQLARFDEAFTQLQALVKHEEVRPEALAYLVELALVQGELAEAKDWVLELLRYNATDNVYQQYYGNLLHLIADDAAATAYWQKLLQQYRFSAFDHIEPYLALSRSQLRAAQGADLAGYKQLLKQFFDTLQSVPLKLLNAQGAQQQNILLAHGYLLQGDGAKSEALLAEVSAADTGLPINSMLDLVWYHFACNETKTATELLQRANTVADELSQSGQGLARLLVKQFTKILSDSNQQLRQWQQQGEQQLQANKPKAALQALRSAFLLCPGHGATALNLVQVLAMLPGHKALKPLASAVLQLLNSKALTSKERSRLATLTDSLPELYLD
ncbi:Response regulator receiver domain-containing protein [Arsukibacterium tuosuense]|uniref:Response regulator receiver domain-containing protein n=1 Tax=Arsukibacterium tuosuense TaxID=1323745 RepID=A0A285J3L3_9GAMM|nr:response regulator [Arsukibacterium tuosuense]SNY54782.1 Response regulator receiver domain-containing protein [Arsukibacterium tuosuense]